MAEPYAIPCSEHGESAWCYVMPDGRHIDAEDCACFRRHSLTCPVHKELAKEEREAERSKRKMWKA